MSQLLALASQLSSTPSTVFGLHLPETPMAQVASGIVVVTVFTYLIKRIRARNSLNGVPEPSGRSFLWGHLRTVAEMSVGSAFAAWMDELHAQVFQIGGALFNSDILVVGDPLAATYIQKHVYDYPHTQVVRCRVIRTLGKSLGWVEGESEHKRMRALVSPSLGPEALRAGTPGVYIAAENLAENLKMQVLEHNGTCEIDIMSCVNKAALETIGRVAFGHDFEGGHSNDARKILGAWRSVARFGASSASFYALAVLRRFPLLNHVPMKALREQEEVRKTIQQGIARELAPSNQAEGQDIKGNDLLSRLTSAHTSGSINTDELMDHITTIIMTGSETTAQTLTYAIWELARHPDIQSRLREEVMAYAGSPSYDDLQTQLPYLDAVMREVFRLHPAIPSMERIAIKDDVLPLRHPITGKNGKEITSIHISAGQTLIIPIYTMNRLDSIWGDGANFRPERWMEELPQKELCVTGWSRMLTFSDGPRNCIGFRVAILEFKVILFTLVQRFKFGDVGVDIINKVAPSLQPVVIGEEHKGPRLPVNVSFL